MGSQTQLRCLNPYQPAGYLAQCLVPDLGLAQHGLLQASVGSGVAGGRGQGGRNESVDGQSLFTCVSVG